MPAEALAKAGADVCVLGRNNLVANQGCFESADALVIWRMAWSKKIESIINTARKDGAKIVFDVDDLMFDPALAKTGVIDGIRSQGFEESRVAELYARMQRTMFAADYCICPTRPLATAVRGFQKPVFVLPNGFDAERYRRSRKAAADRQWPIPMDWFALATRQEAERTRRISPERQEQSPEYSGKIPESRLVLFRSEDSTGSTSYLVPEEFPELDGLAGQIEWRGLVPVDDLSLRARPV
jgi:hypothetical protein